jgi:polysaccharide pyruvyl transferase WcaK-like protein
VKICHLASYNKNIGDNAAIYNIREWFKCSDLKIDWHSVDLNNFYSRKNDVSFCKKFFIEGNKKYDAYLIGGGGLIEGHSYNSGGTGWKLPFTQEILNLIERPLYCVGLGVNYFRGRDKLTPTGFAHLNLLIGRADYFSVRNDGSYEILDASGQIQQMDRVTEIPDPGLIYSRQNERKTNPYRGFFQPARNSSPLINKDRGLTPDVLLFLEQFCINNGLLSMPHTPKDLSFFGGVPKCFVDTSFMDLLKEENYVASLAPYYDYDYAVVMRGHGQLISVGANLPAIYLATQDKVSGFAEKSGYKNYTVDTQDPEWRDKLMVNVSKLKFSKTYLSEWYEINEANINRFHAEWGETMSTLEEKMRTV